ncbi:DUF11 domain-containing protein [Actinomadura fibrosa]|uniref:DUF11 domain-containing protein n=1 Tax=Actinomadura fibrosa TaxID=111802 RepID=A0ABW2XG80_9ACTN|nr:DUF11 domain-containing protein [Actinomadura fibrosa]
MRRVLAVYGSAGVLLACAGPVFAQDDADLGVSVSASVRQARPGGEIAYTVTVRNQGAGAAERAEMVFTVPRDVAVVALEEPGCAEKGREVRCAVPGGARTERAFHVHGVVAPSAVGELRAVAAVTSATPDPVPGNDRVELVTPVLPSTDLRVRLAAPHSASRRGRIPLKVTVTNRGPRAAGRVGLLLGAHGARIRVPGCAVTGQTANDQYLRCTLDGLEPGASKEVKPAVSAIRARARVVEFGASVSCELGESRPGDNAAATSVHLR